MPGWHSVTDRESFKIPQSTSPPLFVPVREGTGKITQGTVLCVCVCVFVCTQVCVLTWHLYCVCVWGNVMCSLHELVHGCWATVFVYISIGRGRAEWSHVDLRVHTVCSERLSLTCHIVVCYYWPWQVRPEKAAFIEPDWKFIHKKSIPLIRSTHLWFTPICIYPKHRIKSMKLITLSCCLCADTHTHTHTHSFPLQTVIMNSAKCLQPSVLPPSHQAGQLCTLYIQYSCHVWGWGFTVWSSEQTLAITDCLLSLWKGIIL